MKDCPRCKGTGKVRDEAKLGGQMQERRKAANLTLREVSKQMGITIGYLCDLEHGRRIWSPKLQQSFQEAIS